WLTCSSIPGAVRGSLGKHALEIAAALEPVGARSDLVAIVLVARRAEPDRPEHFGRLALGKRIAPGELFAQLLRALAAANRAVLPGPAEHRVLTGQTPGLLPVVVGRDVTLLEVVGVDQVL